MGACVLTLFVRCDVLGVGGVEAARHAAAAVKCGARCGQCYIVLTRFVRCEFEV